MILERENPSFYGGDELRQVKQKKIQRIMEKYQFDALLLFSSPSVRYVTDFFPKGYRAYTQDIEYLALVPRGKEAALGYSSGSDDYRVKTRCLTKDVRKLGSYSNWPKVIAQLLSDYGLERGRIGTDLLLFDIYDNIKKLLPKVNFVKANEIWTEITCIKHPIEIKYLKKATEIVGKGLEASMEAIKDGVSELEVAAAGEYAMRMAGLEVQFGILQVASGKNSAIFERIATEKIIKNGEMVILDYCSLYRGYQGDLARTAICGEASDIQKEIFAVQKGSLKAAIDIMKPGVKCSEVDTAAREYITKKGYGKYMHKFATGHQLGYAFHGSPLIAAGVEDRLHENMVVNLEPRVHLFDQWDVGGVNNEDTLLITADGTINLSKDVKFDEKLL